MAASSFRMTSCDEVAQPSEPRPPALDTAIASALPCEPAIGAWMIGSSMPKRSVMVTGRVLPALLLRVDLRVVDFAVLRVDTLDPHGRGPAVGGNRARDRLHFVALEEAR